MHFHLPNSIFIYDNFSYKHTKNHEKGVYKFSIVSNPSLISISFNNSELKELKKYIYQELQGKNNFANKEREYIDHVSKSYLVLCKLYSYCQGRKQVTPRMVDNFLLAANHKQ